MISISVIIPIYGVEHFIGRCAESLMCQTLREGVEFIFVDDATPDGSIQVLQEVLDRYPERQGQVSILHHDVNQGLPAARNTGLAIAQGKYIFHCDGDDYVERDMLEVLLGAAEQQRADYVWCDPEARHGIVLTADYIAKKYGVKTGMALWQAKQVCPDITFVSPRMDLYLRFSRMAHEIYAEYTEAASASIMRNMTPGWTGSTGCSSARMDSTWSDPSRPPGSRSIISPMTGPYSQD